MHGLLIDAHVKFSTLLEPILSEFDSLYWYVDSQLQPISPEAFGYDHEAWFAHVLDAPPLHHSSGQLWQRGTLPRLADHVYPDEWSYFTGFTADDEAAAVGVVEQFSSIRD